jgi:hypothetical protein
MIFGWDAAHIGQPRLPMTDDLCIAAQPCGLPITKLKPTPEES